MITPSTVEIRVRSTELIKKGYQPPVAAFNIYNGEGDDVTEEIIGNPGPVLLLVAPKLEEADDEQMDEINGVYDYALEHDIPFYCVTGSSPEAIAAWRQYRSRISFPDGGRSTAEDDYPFQPRPGAAERRYDTG